MHCTALLCLRTGDMRETGRASIRTRFLRLHVLSRCACFSSLHLLAARQTDTRQAALFNNKPTLPSVFAADLNHKLLKSLCKVRSIGVTSDDYLAHCGCLGPRYVSATSARPKPPDMRIGPQREASRTWISPVSCGRQYRKHTRPWSQTHRADKLNSIYGRIAYRHFAAQTPLFPPVCAFCLAQTWGFFPPTRRLDWRGGAALSPSMLFPISDQLPGCATEWTKMPILLWTRSCKCKQLCASPIHPPPGAPYQRPL